MSEDGSCREVDLREMELADEESLCFLCGRFLREFPAIGWHGATGFVVFHPDCAASFIFRLSRDVWEYQREASRNPSRRKRTA